jgi:hypothetical protein
MGLVVYNDHRKVCIIQFKAIVDDLSDFPKGKAARNGDDIPSILFFNGNYKVQNSLIKNVD